MRSISIALILLVITIPAFSGELMKEWDVVRTVDELRNKEIVTAFYVKSDGPFDKKAVIVRCKNDQFEIYIDFDEYLGSDYFVSTAYKFDDGRIYQQRWSTSTDNTAVFADNPITFAIQLMRSMQVVVEVEDYEGIRHQEIFPLNGSANAISQVIDHCE